MRIEEIENTINPVVSNHGCELWGIDLLRGKKRPTIRVYIDAIAGATIDDCEKIAKDLNYELAVNDTFIDQDYILEVSTPGIDRKFFKAEQLTSFIEEEFNLKLRESIDGKKTLTARLLNVDNNKILFNYDNEELNLNFLDIDLCRLKPNFKELMRVNK
mgnify:CR=1 FL=1|jgi:ribosome maturation factor RimP|tara:strand:+ start:271 stop:747 length:477 start_codon:yes stop_codon:yes gene_type:complete